MSESALDPRARSGAMDPPPVAVPAVTIRTLGALLALAITVAHVADQGTITHLTTPHWLGWAYRLIEVGGLATALALTWRGTARLGWTAGVLLGAGPLIGYVLSRTIGLPSDADDIGNWDDWVGTFSLLVEVALISLSVAMLRGRAPKPAPDGVSLADATSLWLPAHWH